MSAWDEAVETVRNNWSSGALHNKDNEWCALGAVGHALWGDVFDSLAEGADIGQDGDGFENGSYADTLKAYEMLRQSPKARKMVSTLRSVIEEQDPEGMERVRKLMESEKAGRSNAWLANEEVLNYNDSADHETMVSMFEKARGASELE